MKKSTIITQEWWINEGDKNIPTSHQERLEEEGLNHALEMMQDSYTSGELYYEEEDGTQYNGFWNLTTKSE